MQQVQVTTVVISWFRVNNGPKLANDYKYRVVHGKKVQTIAFVHGVVTEDSELVNCLRKVIYLQPK